MSKTPRDDRPEAAEEAVPGPELRLIDRKAYVGLGAFDLVPGVRVADLSLQIPNVTFPFNVTGGANRYQKQRCLFGQLDLELSPALLRGVEERMLQGGPELATLKLHLRAGFIEGEGTLRAGRDLVPFTCRVAFDGEADGVAALVFDVRLYGPCSVPAPVIAGGVARAALSGQIVPGVVPRGFAAIAAMPLGELLRRTVPQRGFRLPEASAARLGSALVSPQGILLRFSAGAPPPGGLADEELLLAVEGARTFEEGEALLEAGSLSRAREFYLRAGELAQAHPFATERLISLLLGDSDVTDYALDLVRALGQRRPLSPAPLWMEALLRLQRDERPIAAQRFLDLAALARGRGEESSAFWAAQAAASAAGTVAPGLAVRALHEALGLRPDHFPSLQALAEAAERAGDPAAALRAYRRLTAVSRDATQASHAHVRLGELSSRVENDLAGARLHYDAALRLTPDAPDALLGLADLCARSGEPLRALRALDRVREICRGDPSTVARAELEAGAVYEHALKQPENARLRYAEAARARPGDPEPLVRRSLMDERLNRVPEAVEGLSQALELLGVPSKERAPLAHQAHRALARIARDHLHRPERNRQHLESAVSLKPDDLEAWEELIPLYRADEVFAPLARALAAAAPRAEPRRRVAMLVEAGNLHRLRLGEGELARARYREALAIEPRAREAIEGMLALEEQAADMGAACEHLRALLELSAPGPQRLPLLRRLQVAARDGKKDLDLAARATREILALAPDELAARSELVTLQRRRGDLPALAEALEQWAQGCERLGDTAATAAALRELAGLYDQRLGRQADALSALEKAHALLADDAGVLADLADLSLRAGRHRLARQSYRSLLAAQPPDAPRARTAELQERLARAAEATGDLNEAIGALEEAYRLSTEDRVAERLDLLLGQARRDEARADLCRRRGGALARAGRAGAAAQVLSQGAALTRALGDAGASARDFSAALAADPSGPTAPTALEALAELAIAAHQPGEAATFLARRASLATDGRDAARRFFRAAELCAGLDDARALQLLATAVLRDGNFAPARRALAERRAQSGELHAAWQEAEAALDVEAHDPDSLAPSAQRALEKAAARWAEQAQDRPASVRLWSRYLVHHPEDIEARRQQVAQLRHLGDLNALAPALEALEGRLSAPASSDVARELAHLFDGALGRVEAAIAAWRRVRVALPDDREALEALARLLSGPSEVDARVEVLSRLAGLSASPEAAAPFLLQQGVVLRQALRFADAAAAFTQAARAAQDAAPALDALIESAEEAQQPQSALAARRERAALAARRGDVDAPQRLLDVAARFRALGEPGPARESLAALLGLVPTPELRRAAHKQLADMARAQGELRESLTHTRALAGLGTGPERVALLRDAAQLALAVEDAETARDVLSEALVFAPRDAALVRSLAQVQARLGDVDGEVESLIQLAELPEAPKSERASLWMQAARRLLELPAPARAEAALRKAFALAPGLAAAREALTQLLLDRGAWEEGLGLLERSADALADSDAASDLLLQGVDIAEHQLHDGPTALRLARKALRRAPGRAEVVRRIAERVYLSGGTDEAAPLLTGALDALDPAEQPDRWITLALELAELRSAQSQPQAALQPLLRAAELAPWRSDVALALHHAQALSDPRSALVRLTQHLRSRHPGTGTHRLLRYAARAALDAADAPLAASLLEEALPTAGDGAPSLEAELIDLHLQLGNRFAAVALLRSRAERALGQSDRQGALSAWRRAAPLLEDAGALPQALELWGGVVEQELALGRHREAAAVLVHRGAAYADALQKWPEAESDFRRALELDPQQIDAAVRGQAVAQARGDAAGEAELLAIEIDRVEDAHRRAQAYLRLAELSLGALQQPARGEAALRNALVLEPRFAAARDRWEALLQGQDRKAELGASIAARADDTAAPETRVALLRSASELFLQARQPGAAAEALEQARAIAPDDEGLALATADALSRAGRDEECAFIDAALLARNPTVEAPFQRELGRRQAARDVRGEAALHQKRAMGEAPRDAAPRFLVAATLFEQSGDLDAARRCELWAFERSPDDDRSFARVAARHQKPEQRRLLEGIYRRRAAFVASEAPGLHLSRARLLVDLQLPDEASEALDEALSGDPATLSPLVSVPALLLRADLEFEKNGALGASRFDERLLEQPELQPADQRRVRARLGHARAQVGHDEEATRLWEAAAEGAPTAEALPLLDLLGSAYARLSDGTAQARVLLARVPHAPEGERAALLRAAAGLDEAGPLGLLALRGLSELDPEAGDLLKLARLELARGEAEAGRESLVRAARAALVPRVQASLLLEAAALCDAAALGDASLGDPALGDAAALGDVGQGSRGRALRREARKADPHHLDVLTASEADLARGGAEAREERREVLEALVALEPDEARKLALRESLAQLYLDAGEPRLALAQLLSWADASPGSGRAVALSRAESLTRTQPGWEDARAGVLERLAELEPDGRFARYMEAAADWQAAGEPGRARTALTRAALADPDAPGPWQALASLHGAAKELAEQAQALEEVAHRQEGEAAAQALSEAAGLWQDARRPAPALEALRQAVALSPRPSRRLRLAEACEDQGLWAEALAARRALLAEVASPPEGALRAAALLAARVPDAEAARALWHQVLAQAPLDDEAYAALAKLEPSPSARAALHQGRAVALAAAQRPAAATWDEAGRAFEAAGDLPAALSALRLAAQEDPRADGALARWREVERLAASTGHAEALIEALTLRAPREADPSERAAAYHRLATVLEQQGDGAGALAALGQAAAERPDRQDLRELLFVRLEQAGEFEQLARKLEQVQPQTAALQQRRAAALLRAGAVDAATDALIEGLRLDAQSPELLQALAVQRDALEGDKRASLLERWSTLAPGPEAARMLAEVAGLRTGDDRVRALQASFQADPAGPASFGLLREALVDAGEDRPLASLLEARAGAVADPAERGHLLMELGELLEGPLEDLPAAAEAYERSLRADPTNLSVQRDLAELCFDLGRDDRARQLNERLLELGGASKPLALQRLAALATRAGDRAGTVAHLRAYVELVPQDTAAIAQLREAAQAAADRDAEAVALRALLRAGGLAEEAQVETLTALTALEKGLGRLDAASQSLTARLGLRPLDREGWREALELASARNDVDGELSAAAKLVDLEPEPHARAMLLLLRARRLAARRDWEAACQAASHAAGLTPGDEMARREWFRCALEGQLPAEIALAGLALTEVAGDAAVQPHGRALGEALLAAGERDAALRFLAAELAAHPTDAGLLGQLVPLAEGLGRTREHVEWSRALFALEPPARPGEAFRGLAAEAEGPLGDVALATALYAEAFRAQAPTDAELLAQAARHAGLGQTREAAGLQAEAVRRAPGDRARWAALTEAAKAAALPELEASGAAVEAFLTGATPDQPSKAKLEPELRQALLDAVPAPLREALQAEARRRWAALAAPRAGLRAAGPVLLGRLQALADGLGVARPGAVMDPTGKGVGFAGPEVLVVGIGLFSLPARVQDAILSLALARAHYGLAFAGGDVAGLVAAAEAAGGLSPTAPAAQVEAMVESLAAGWVDDPLAVIVGHVASDPRFVQADLRGWDRAAALQGPGQRGAAAGLVAARLRR
jgi:tetratricopeptide (TPR) repeat protein